MVYIGIDPGANGGIAWINSKGCGTAKMPMTPKDILDCISIVKDLAKENEDDSRFYCVLEDVGHGMPGQSSSATAKFARHCGLLEMALVALGIPFCKATPIKWMKAMSCGKSKDYPSKVAWKNHLKEMAQREFPDIQVTLWNSDALLIAKYAQQVNN